MAKSFEERYDVKALSVQADLSNLEAPKRLVEAAKSQFADTSDHFQIDIIVNNAATVNAQSINALDLDLFDATYNLNCKAPALLVKVHVPIYQPTALAALSISRARLLRGVYGGRRHMPELRVLWKR